MKQMDVFKKIGGILQELNDQYDYLKADSSDLNELELELFVANAHFLKDHAEILRKIHERNTPATEKQEAVVKPEPVVEKPQPATIPVAKQEPIHERRFFEPVVQQKPVVEAKLELSNEVELPVQPPYNPVNTEIADLIPVKDEPEPVIDTELESTADSYTFEQREPETISTELVTEEVSILQEEAKAAEPVAIVETQVATEEPIVEKAEPVAQSELFKPMIAKTEVAKAESDQILTFNQKMSAQKAERGNGLSAQVNALPVTDLKSAINLNDKLLYIKDLFNGYSLAYSEAIEIVNRFNTFEEAERFLKTNYVAKNNWDGKASTAEKFYALLRRRYPTV